MRAVILTARKDALSLFAQGLGMDILWSNLSAEILAKAKDAAWDVVVVDGLMPGFDYKKFLIDLLQINAMLNTVVITDMNATEFHEESEGLGVLCALSPRPGQTDGVQVSQQLKTILGG